MPLAIRATAGSSPPRSFPPLALPVLLLVTCVSLSGACAFAQGADQRSSDTPSPTSSTSPAPPANTAGLSFYNNAHPYLEEPLKHLQKHIRELRGLRAAANQDLLPIILMHTGMRVHELFANLVDLSAHEDVAQKILTVDGVRLGAQQGQYDYLILVKDHDNPPHYEEYRTTMAGSSPQQQGLEEGYAITTGFALKCIYFSPALHGDSTFRYLGDQMLDGRDTYVVAFAQLPTQTGFWGTVTGDWGTVRILDQGLAWIDKSTFQILRLRTDLLAAHQEIGLARQTTEITFAAVQIADLPAPLWLPSDASVDADFQGHTFRNEHHYRDYQRFRVSVKIGAPRLHPAYAGETTSEQ